MHKDTFDYKVGLVMPRSAPKELAQRLIADIGHGFGVEDVSMARFLRFNAWSTCAAGDAILIKDGHGFIAGWVWKNLSIHGVPVSLVQCGDLVSKDAEKGIATWTLRSTPEWVSVRLILDVTIFCWESHTVLRTLLPRAFR